MKWPGGEAAPADSLQVTLHARVRHSTTLCIGAIWYGGASVHAMCYGQVLYCHR